MSGKFKADSVTPDTCIVATLLQRRLAAYTSRAGSIDDNNTKGGGICIAQVIRQLPAHTRVALLTVGSCVCVYRLASEGPVVADVLPAAGPCPPALVQRLLEGAGRHVGPQSSSMAPLQRALESLR